MSRRACGCDSPLPSLALSATKGSGWRPQQWRRRRCRRRRSNRHGPALDCETSLNSNHGRTPKGGKRVTLYSATVFMGFASGSTPNNGADAPSCQRMISNAVNCGSPTTGASLEKTARSIRLRGEPGRVPFDNRRRRKGRKGGGEYWRFGVGTILLSYSRSPGGWTQKITRNPNKTRNRTCVAQPVLHVSNHLGGALGGPHHGALGGVHHPARGADPGGVLLGVPACKRPSAQGG